MTTNQWLEQIDHPTRAFRQALRKIYGEDRQVVEERLALLRRVLRRFAERFGDRPVRVFRSPGRINLRGMHVDTHGGYLNLMTHQREVIVVASPEPGDTATFVNIDPEFDEVSFWIDELADHPSFKDDWMRFITHPDIQNRVLAKRGQWGNYLEGTVLRALSTPECACRGKENEDVFLEARHLFPERHASGLCAAVGSDVPRGAALSSSMALCVAVLQATLGLSGKSVENDPFILAAQGAEWYTGSRCGVSDQAAMILGGRDEMVSVALLRTDLDTSQARRIAFPDELRVLVIHSYTERSLSGAHTIEYTRNRFAYSLALAVLRHEMTAQGLPQPLVSGADRLSNLSTDAFEPVGGTPTFFGLLKAIPEEISLDALRSRYEIPDFEQTYDRYFGTSPEDLRPKTIGLRGPLLFGVAESERARLFTDAIESGDYDRAGRLMTIGHDGDRRVSADGSPYSYDVSDAAIDRLVATGTPLEECPGAYGASGPALDALVDAALTGGALGASLTGAGIAGAVLALCRAEDADRVAESVRSRLAAPDYAALADREVPLTDDEITNAVVANHATAPAGEFLF